MAVYKRGKKGVFYMGFIVNGIQICRSTGKFTKKEAKIVEAVEKKMLMEKSVLSPREKRARMKLSEAINKIYDEKWKHNKDGCKSYRNAEIVKELIGDVPISTIDEDVVSELVIKLEAKGIKSGTVNRYLAALKTLLRHNRQPWEHITLKKEPIGRTRVVTEDEAIMANELFRNSDHPPQKQYFYDVADLLEVLADTGWRLSEILFVTYKQISFEANLITSWVNKGKKPKSIPMTDRVRAIMLKRSVNAAQQPFNMTVAQVERAWSWVRDVMGLKHDKEFVPHSLRHTCASGLVNADIDLYVVKEWLGHSTIRQTERYAHLNPAKLQKALSTLNKFSDENALVTNDIMMDSCSGNG